MAETMTYDAGTDTVSTSENLTTDEQDSLQVGEAMQEQQESMLAGKYKNAQELENAYIELEKKLGEKSGTVSEDVSSDEQESEPEPDEPKEEKSNDVNDFAFLDDFYSQASSEKGEVSKEMIEKISQMTPVDMAKNFLQWRQDAESKYMPIPEMTQQNVTELKAIVGGDKNYANMLQWAQSNLQRQEIEMFDAVMSRGDVASAFFAINSLAQKYQDQSGYDGKMLTGTPPKSGGDTYRSQAEMVAAMNDPKYDKDPAYRRDVMEKVARSDIKF